MILIGNRPREVVLASDVRVGIAGPMQERSGDVFKS